MYSAYDRMYAYDMVGAALQAGLDDTLEDPEALISCSVPERAGKRVVSMIWVIGVGSSTVSWGVSVSDDEGSVGYWDTEYR